jgi:3-polyprenyl-4-hydroxybenzoate decarboxylase
MPRIIATIIESTKARKGNAHGERYDHARQPGSKAGHRQHAGQDSCGGAGYGQWNGSSRTTFCDEWYQEVDTVPERKQDMPVAITIGAHPALYLGCLTLAPFGVDEFEIMGGLPKLSRIYESVKRDCPGIKNVYMPAGGFCRNLCYVSIKKTFEGEPAMVAAAVFTADFFVRHVVVVDADVDIYSDTEVLKAIHLNMNIERNFVIPYAKGDPTDPTNRNGVVTKIGIDATVPLGKVLNKFDFSDHISAADMKRIFPD